MPNLDANLHYPEAKANLQSLSCCCIYPSRLNNFGLSCEISVIKTQNIEAQITEVFLCFVWFYISFCNPGFRFSFYFLWSVLPLFLCLVFILEMWIWVLMGFSLVFNLYFLWISGFYLFIYLLRFSFEWVVSLMLLFPFALHLMFLLSRFMPPSTTFNRLDSLSLLVFKYRGRSGSITNLPFVLRTCNSTAIHF